MTTGLTERSIPVMKRETGVGWPLVLVLNGPICHVVPMSIAPFPIPIPFRENTPGPAGPIIMELVNICAPLFMTTPAVPYPMFWGTTKFICPDAAYCIIAAVPLTVNEQPPSVVGYIPFESS